MTCLMAKIRVKQGDNEIEIDSRDFYVDNDSAAEVIESLKQQLQKPLSNNVMNSLDFYLELTNAFNDSFLDIFKKKSIFLIYSYIFMIWLEDDSDELSKTMSELDKLLTFSEKIALDFKTYTPF